MAEVELTAEVAEVFAEHAEKTTLFGILRVLCAILCVPLRFYLV